MALEKLGYLHREDRDAKVRQLRLEGRRHIAQYSTHEGNDPKIIYVVVWDEPSQTVAEEKPNENSTSIGAVRGTEGK